MSKYTPYKDVATLALSSMSVLNGEWQFAIQGLPTIEIVRCGECKYWHKNIKEGDDIPVYEACYDFTADDFCSYGERREP